MTNVEKIAVQRFGQDGLKLINEVVAKECLVHIQMNDKRVSSLLASPEDLIDLALGHSPLSMDAGQIPLTSRPALLRITRNTRSSVAQISPLINISTNHRHFLMRCV